MVTTLEEEQAIKEGNIILASCAQIIQQSLCRRLISVSRVKEMAVVRMAIMMPGIRGNIIVLVGMRGSTEVGGSHQRIDNPFW